MMMADACADMTGGKRVVCRTPGSAPMLSFGTMNQPSDPAELARLSQRLVELRLEHRDLDFAIERLHEKIVTDELAIKRLKKRKLQLKDAIIRFESALIPDEPA